MQKILLLFLSLLCTGTMIRAQAEAGQTYSYNFADGSVLPQTGYSELNYESFTTADGLVTINSNTDNESLQFGYHDATHGGVFFPGNSFDIAVAGDALITFFVCTYASSSDAVFELTGANDEVLGTIAAQNLGEEDGFPSTFSYEGPAGTVTATLLSEDSPTGQFYIHGLSVENADEIVDTEGKSLVWDFGAEQLNGDAYTNQLDEATVNGWYDASVEAGSAGNVLPEFSSNGLTWVGGGNDRLRTSNTNLTRYDENVSGNGEFNGRIYVNSAGAVGRYLSLALEENDEITVYALSQNGGGQLNFQYAPDPTMQTDVEALPGELTEFNFVAKQAGMYKLFDTQDKPSYYRIVRRSANYVSLTGSVDVTEATDIPGDYTLQFTNADGKVFETTVESGSYRIDLPAGYTYELSLGRANGYIISSGSTLDVTESTTTFDITIIRTELYTVSGDILGLPDVPSDLMLMFTSQGAIYQPEVSVDPENGTYTVSLEAGRGYGITATGVNDYSLAQDSVTIAAEDTEFDITFVPKPVYAVTVQTSGLSSEQQENIRLTFTNLNEAGYSYTFDDLGAIQLRDGVYSIQADGLSAYPVALALTSNLTVDGKDTTKTLVFEPVNRWSFDDAVIASGDANYRGLQFTGAVSNEIGKGHLVAGPDATIAVPVNPGEAVIVTYYYSADFSIEGGESITTSSGSTSMLESTTYVYPGEEGGYVTITVGDGAGSTYITEIRTVPYLDYTSTLAVGADKDYQTINAALEAIRLMSRDSGERVTIMIDPGNYEEMLVIDMPEVTLKNAAATPSIALMNEGVDIDPNAVRITSYYGHGYDYFSMGSDQKYDADVLAVNRDNGYLSNENAGAGTTNGSYWNATVVVYALGFQAEDIIFENSFNQYISQKESEDVVVMWDSGSKGERPTDYGNTSVQDRSYVERAAAIAVVGTADKVILDKCRVIGRQDSFYGGRGARVVVFRGSMMGAVDYLFGGMTAVFYQSELAMNTSDASSDRAYITAAQQDAPRGYLMYETTVTTAIPGTETASEYRAKPGYYGRPWQATTSEVVFYNTTIDTSDYPGYVGMSLIEPEGWASSLGGESEMMYEYGTVERSGESHLDQRVEWSTVLTEPVLTDGTQITPFHFTKGDDDWDPLPALIEQNPTSTRYAAPVSKVRIYAAGDRIFVSNVQGPTTVTVYSLSGARISQVKVEADGNFRADTGVWIVTADAPDGRKAAKVYTQR
ncbi:pectinesterase family protein [Lewinella sp. IMCC34191]|uniref:pectinesterase family protein n=1 Tax=Lewinella sp. IMCC34191 TaxID=2259172 RepID=UPI000E27CFDD|nr:pectinesterase family protein [Lewinella sp. IMCC34191]